MLLSQGATRGSQILQVERMMCGLEVGMLLGLGTAKSPTLEDVVISGFGSILLAAPLQHDHVAGESISFKGWPGGTHAPTTGPTTSFPTGAPTLKPTRAPTPPGGSHITNREPNYVVPDGCTNDKANAWTNTHLGDARADDGPDGLPDGCAQRVTNRVPDWPPDAETDAVSVEARRYARANDEPDRVPDGLPQRRPN